MGQQASLHESCHCPVTTELKEAKEVTSLGQLRAIGKVPLDTMGSAINLSGTALGQLDSKRTKLDPYLTPYKTLTENG